MDFEKLFTRETIERNVIEHEYLPRAFFEQPMKFMALLMLKKAEIIAKLYDIAAPDKYKP